MLLKYVNPLLFLLITMFVNHVYTGDGCFDVENLVPPDQA